MDYIERATELFSAAARPEHFTDYQHCCECAEHDATLQGRDPQSLKYEDMPPSWDPMCFVTEAGFRYYFPGLVRLAMSGSGATYYLDQLLFHLTYEGMNNRHRQSFTVVQRQYVVQLLAHLVETRAEEIEQNRDTDTLFSAIEIWSASSVQGIDNES